MKQILSAWLIALLLLGGCIGQNESKEKSSTFLSLLYPKAELVRPNTNQKASGLDVDPKYYFVDPGRGSDESTGEPYRPFKTLTKALSVVAYGDRIYVTAGSYSDENGEKFPITIPAGVTVIGDELGKGMIGGWSSEYGGIGYPPGGDTWIWTYGETANIPGSSINAAVILEKDATITGFRITNLNYTLPSRFIAGIVVRNSGVTIRNNTINGTGGDGIYIDATGVGTNTITGNVISENTNGMTVYNSNAVTTKFENNSVVYSYFGGVTATNGTLDLGGGAAGSSGNNLFACNKFNLISNALQPYNLFAKNNQWEHIPLVIQNDSNGTKADFINWNNLTNLEITGGTVTTEPCL